MMKGNINGLPDGYQKRLRVTKIVYRVENHSVNIMVENQCLRVADSGFLMYECMNVPFDMKKLALITMQGDGLSIAFGNHPEKNNEQFESSHSRGQVRISSSNGVPARRKRTFYAMNVWLSCV